MLVNNLNSCNRALTMFLGKYIPAIGYRIDQAGSMANMNFQGAIIGDGWTDPISQSDYASYLYQVTI